MWVYRSDRTLCIYIQSIFYKVISVTTTKLLIICTNIYRFFFFFFLSILSFRYPLKRCLKERGRGEGEKLSIDNRPARSVRKFYFKRQLQAGDVVIRVVENHRRGPAE